MPLYTRIRFRGNAHSKMMILKLHRAMRKTFITGKLQLLFSTHPMVPLRLKDKLPRIAIFFYIYQFNCSCGASYIARCFRDLYFRAREFLPVCLRKSTVKLLTARSSPFSTNGPYSLRGAIIHNYIS